MKATENDLFDRDCLITYHSPSTKVIAAIISIEYWWLYNSGFGLNKGLQTLWTVPTSVYAIDILTLCCLLHCKPMRIY